MVQLADFWAQTLCVQILSTVLQAGSQVIHPLHRWVNQDQTRLNWVLSGCNFVLLLAASVLVLLTWLLLLECLAAIAPRLRESAPAASSAPSVVILMPAHNEAAVVEGSIKAILAQLQQDIYLAQAKLWLIADNCTDNTAQLGLAAGAVVLERHNDEARGKGYALDYGLQQLAPNPPEVVVMIDADCFVQAGAIAALVRAAIAKKLPIQGAYYMTLPPQAGLKDRIAAFAFRVRNGVRLAGLSRLGQPCLLMGTGMAFPWESLQQVSLASGELVEDMKLGLDLAIAQYPPQFCAEAVVTASLPQGKAAAQSQRTRWEHGRLDLTRRYWPRLIALGVTQGRLGLIALALDMAILPLSLLVSCWLGVTLLCLAFGLGTVVMASVWLCALAGIFLALAILIAWWQLGRQVLPLGQLLLVPVYIFWKLPIYLRFMTRPERRWVRTERDVF